MTQTEQLLKDLVSINSINPDILPGAPGEAEIARYIAAWLENAGLEVDLHEAAPGRPNVVGIARGSGGGKSLLLNGHMDTVGILGMQDPFYPVVENGRIYGRGTYDMKGGLAAQMLAAAAAKKLPLGGDVIFTAVADEELAGIGTIEIAKRYQADAAIIAEPTDLKLIVAHRGFVWLEVEVQGTAAHGSRPDLGVDAILKMGRVLVDLERLEQKLSANPTHPLLGSGSLHASLINGGQEPSTYPDLCTLALERRTVPGETPEKVEAEVEAILQRHRELDPRFRAVVRRGVDRNPMETPKNAEITAILQEAAAQFLGQRPEPMGVPYWTDAATLWSAGIPSVLFGPSGAGAHAVEEWVDVSSVEACAEIFTATVREFCK
jgi:acetylornithine deacetylase